MDSAYNFKGEIKRKYKTKKNQDDSLKSILFYRGTKRNNFFTDDSGLYFDCNDKKSEEFMRFRSDNKFFDGLNKKAVFEYKKVRSGNSDFLWIKYRTFALKLNQYQDNFNDRKNYFLESFSLVRLWNTSILAAIIIGMMSMSLVYRYLGQGVDAKDETVVKAVAGVSMEQEEEKEISSREEDDKYIVDLAKYLEIEASKDFNRKVKELVKGYPIEHFLPYLLNEDHEVVSFYIAIARKESNWGKRVPVLNGKDCYNYVGYRGKSEKMGTGGHTCFANREEAVRVVSRRIEELIKKYGRDTAKEMVVWKCGSDCNATGGQAAANKWISDVDTILKELKKSKK